jgi:uncharacterized protein (DUF924 family)
MTANQSTTDAAEPSWVGEVLDFWFRRIGAARWFAKDATIDEEIRARFLALHERILGSGAEGCTTPRAVLAAVVVLDQFSRNMFRGSPRAFAADPLARRLARATIEQGLDTRLTNEERAFLYMPFEHSEEREDQALSCELFGRLGNNYWTGYALAHKVIIDRFGRFPHRNAVLGRESTPEEVEFLKDPKSSF